MDGEYSVEECACGFLVIPEGIGFLIGPFPTHAAAWEWIDGNSEEGWDDTDRYNRIRMAFAGRSTRIWLLAGGSGRFSFQSGEQRSPPLLPPSE